MDFKCPYELEMELVTKLREDLLASQTNTLSCTLVDMAQSRGNAARTLSYCRDKLGIPVK